MIQRLLVLFFLFGGFVFSQDISYSHRVSPNQIAVGDRIQYTLDLTYPEQVKLLGIPDAKKMPFDVLDKVFLKDNKDDYWALTLQFDMQVFDIGVLAIPTQQVVFQIGKNQKTLVLPAIPLSFRSVLSPGDDGQVALKGIKAPFSLDFQWGWFFVKILGAVLIVLGILMWFFLRRKRSLNPDWGTPVVQEDPVDVAMKQFDQLLARVHGQDAVDFLKEVTCFYDILRGYLAVRFDVQFLHLTGTELLDEMSLLLDEQTLKRMRKVVELSNQIKFSKHEIGLSDFDDMVVKAKDIVLRTKPIDEPVLSEETS